MQQERVEIFSMKARLSLSMNASGCVTRAMICGKGSSLASPGLLVQLKGAWWGPWAWKMYDSTCLVACVRHALLEHEQWAKARR